MDRFAVQEKAMQRLWRLGDWRLESAVRARTVFFYECYATCSVGMYVRT